MSTAPSESPRVFQPGSRPPQFVMVSFDNCLENQSWQEVFEFLQDMNREDADRLRFTFFLSGTALIPDSQRKSYVNPSILLDESESSVFPEMFDRLKRGKIFATSGESNIGFGDTSGDVNQRVRWINSLHRSGNEIASHAIGHFRMGQWSQAMWQHEVTRYEALIDGLAASKNPEISEKLLVSSRMLKGFRAPYLEMNQAGREVLEARNYSYDASDTDQGWDVSNWPKRFVDTAKKSLWNFGLSFVELDVSVQGRNQRVKNPAMDYNFCYKQDGGCPEVYPGSAKNAEGDADRMRDSYERAFLTKYNGSRAPLFIGHHFYPYRSGVYNASLKTFLREICSQAEVRCITHQAYGDFLGAQSEATLKSWRSGSFPKASPLRPQDL